MSLLSSELIETDAGLEALAPAWEALHRRIPGAMPFQSPRWLLPWWRTFGTGQPCITALYDGSDVVGLLPLYILDEPPERKLLPTGIGITDYLDVLLAPGLDAAAELLGMALQAARRRGVTRCDLTDIPPGSPLRGIATPAEWHMSWHDADTCPVLFIPDAAKRLDDVLPAHMRRKLRMNRHRAMRRGGWVVQTATAATVHDILGALIRLHAGCWTARGEPGVLADPAVVAFHREAVPRLLTAGMLRLHALRIDGRVAACCYTLAAGHDRLLLYLSGLDTDFAFESPGSILLGEIIAAAIAEGRREIHFLRGDEAYKYAWGAQPRRNAACRLVPR